MQGILLPAGAPKELVRFLNREIVKVMALPDVKEKCAAARLRRGRQHAGAVRGLHQDRREKWSG